MAGRTRQKVLTPHPTEAQGPLLHTIQAVQAQARAAVQGGLGAAWKLRGSTRRGPV